MIFWYLALFTLAPHRLYTSQGINPAEFYRSSLKTALATKENEGSSLDIHHVLSELNSVCFLMAIAVYISLGPSYIDNQANHRS
jgi:hypothetical protein